MADLTFNIATGRLVGRIGTLLVETNAGAGGRAGSKSPGAENWHLSGNPLATQIGGPAMAGTHTFGPLPVGVYVMSATRQRSNWIVLTPKPTTQTFGRSGFAIHAQGPTGSHGCIVVGDFALLARMYSAVLLAPPSAPLFELDVVAIGQDLDRKFRTA